MLTIRDRVESHLRSSPYLLDAIGRDLVNMSSLARDLQPAIERELRKPVSASAILMTLKRVIRDRPLDMASDTMPSGFKRISCRGDLIQLTLRNSDRLLPSLIEASRRFERDNSAFFLICSGESETNVVVGSELREELESWLTNERIRRTLDDVSAISLRRIDSNGQVGLHIPLQILAWSGIEVIDVASTSSDFTLIIQSSRVDIAVAALHQELMRKK